MRRQRVLRFVLLSLFAGAFIGLVAGLAFGAGTGEGSLKIALNPVSVPSRLVPHSNRTPSLDNR